MYGKIFASIFQGTLRGRAHELLVFINLIACADHKGFVDKHFRCIAEDVGLTEDEVKKAIALLEAPDLESRCQELCGARLERIDEHRNWGWRVVNYLKYRQIRSSLDRTEQTRAAQERFRERAKAKLNAEKSKPSLAKVSQGEPSLAQGEGEVEGEVEGQGEVEVEAPVQHMSSSEPCSPIVTPPETGGVTEAETKSRFTWSKIIKIMDHLNQATGCKYRLAKSAVKMLRARLDEPEVTVDGVLKMIDRQVLCWKGTEMEPYLRPATLFNATKFDCYYATRDLPPVRFSPLGANQKPTTAREEYLGSVSGRDELRTLWDTERSKELDEKIRRDAERLDNTKL